MKLRSSATVMKPSGQSRLLASLLTEYPANTALDLCCGSGFLALTIARAQGSKVVASDISIDAANLCKENSKSNGVSSLVHSVVSDLFSSFSEKKFDLIVCNAPALPSGSDSITPRFLQAGPDGRSVIDRIINDFPAYLTKDGRILLAHSSLADLPKTIRILQDRGVHYTIVAHSSLEFRREYYPHLPHLTTLRERGQAEFSRIEGRLRTTVSVLELC